MSGIVVACIVLFFIAAGLVFGISQMPLSMHLLENNDLSVLHRAGIVRLELCRYRKTVYVNHVPNRVKISLNAPSAVSTSLYTSIEDELELVGYRKSISGHVGKLPCVICVYPYSDENKLKFMKIIQDYNIEK